MTKLSKAERERTIGQITLILERREAARQAFIGEIAEHGFERAAAEKIAGLYIGEKIARYDGIRYVVKHGAFWDAEVLLRALEAAR